MLKKDCFNLKIKNGEIRCILKQECEVCNCYDSMDEEAEEEERKEEIIVDITKGFQIIKGKSGYRTNGLTSWITDLLTPKQAIIFLLWYTGISYRTMSDNLDYWDSHMGYKRFIDDILEILELNDVYINQDRKVIEWKGD